MAIVISDAHLAPAEILAQFQAASKREYGAIVTFIGKVRGKDGDQLILSHYEAMTEKVIEGHISQARQSFGDIHVTIHHRIGAMEVDDVIVMVLVASVHRRAAFDAVDFLMDKLKAQTPFFKQAIIDGQKLWIEPNNQDHYDLTRWAHR